MFLDESLKNDRYKLLSGLLENVKSREILYKILNYFDGNEVMLKEFLSVYHPDLFYFRRLLNLIFLDEVSSEPLDEVQSRLNWASQFGLFDEFKEDSTKLNEGESNAEIAKKLNLQFKRRSYSDNELPF